MNIRKAPKTYLIPLALITLPLYIVGTIWAFIEVGFMIGRMHVIRNLFDQARRPIVEDISDAVVEAIAKAEMEAKKRKDETNPE